MLTQRRAFSIPEILIAIALSAILFALANGALWGVAKLSQNVMGTMQAERGLNFLNDQLRREIGEINWDGESSDEMVRAGEELLIFPTFRHEVIARDHVARGYVQVEWRFDHQKGTLFRKMKVLRLGNAFGRNIETDPVKILTGLKAVHFVKHNGKSWVPIRGAPSVLAKPAALGVEIVLADNDGDHPIFLPFPVSP